MLKSRILIVEDCDDDSHIIEQQLAVYDLTRVHSVASAKSALLTSAFDLVVLDLEFPDESPTQALGHLEPITKAQQIPIVICAGANNSEMLCDFIAKGHGNGAVLKTRSGFEYLRDAVGRVLNTELQCRRLLSCSKSLVESVAST